MTLKEKAERNTEVGGPDLGNVYWEKDVDSAIQELKEELRKMGCIAQKASDKEISRGYRIALSECLIEIDKIMGVYDNSLRPDLSVALKQTEDKESSSHAEGSDNQEGCGKLWCYGYDGNKRCMSRCGKLGRDGKPMLCPKCQKEDVCECGHAENQHSKNGCGVIVKHDMPFKYCKCKKFKSKS